MYLCFVAQAGSRAKSDSIEAVQAKRLSPAGGHRIDLQLARHIHGVAAVGSAKRDGVAARDHCVGADGGGVVEAICSHIGGLAQDSIRETSLVRQASVDTNKGIGSPPP